MKSMSPQAYAKQVKKAKEVVLELPDIMIDLMFKGQWHKRYLALTKSDWYLAIADTTEVGVWKGAGSLPKKWTEGSVKETADFVRDALAHHKAQLLKGRSRTAIEGIINTALPFIQKEKYLLPIAFKGGTGTHGRRGLKLMKGDIDDGCMRSIALAVSGKKKIKLYFGVPKKK